MLTKIEDYLKKRRGVPTPLMHTSRGWNEHFAEYKKKAPILYFLFEVLLQGISNTFRRYVSYPWDNLCRYLRMRFIVKYYEVRIQSLPKGMYSPYSEILLHGAFQVLVDYVEKDINVHAKPIWYRRLRLIPILGYFIPPYRDAESGIKILEEYMNTAVKEEEHFATILSLYLWWKNVRPLREDAFVSSGMAEHMDIAIDDREYLDSEKVMSMQYEVDRIEAVYDKEDEDMLIALIKVRTKLYS